jgi:hypothetical protein
LSVGALCGFFVLVSCLVGSGVSFSCPFGRLLLVYVLFYGAVGSKLWFIGALNLETRDMEAFLGWRSCFDSPLCIQKQDPGLIMLQSLHWPRFFCDLHFLLIPLLATFY